MPGLKRGEGLMYFGSVTNLLNAIGHDRKVTTGLERVGQRDGSLMHVVTAKSSDGEVWRSSHADLLLAVVMLERLMGQTVGESEFADAQASRMHF